MSNQHGGVRHGAGRHPYNPNSRDIRSLFATIRTSAIFPDNDADNNEGDDIVQPPAGRVVHQQTIKILLIRVMGCKRMLKQHLPQHTMKIHSGPTIPGAIFRLLR